MHIDYNLITHEVRGRSVTFAVPSALNDEYIQQLRSTPVDFDWMPYIDKLSKERGRRLRIVDLGANIGIVSLPLAAAGHEVLAIEAELVNFGALVTAARANRFKGFVPVHLAAFSKSSLLAIEGKSFWGQVVEDGDRAPTTFAIPLVEILEAYGFDDADLIKIDIEGAELAATVGLERVVQQNSLMEIIYECNSLTCNHFGHLPQLLIKRFEDLGFHSYYFLDGRFMKTSSEMAQPHFVMDILATRDPEIALGYLPVEDYSHEWAESEIRRAAGRQIANHYEHALRQEPFMRPDFVASPLWQAAKKIALKTKQADLKSTPLPSPIKYALGTPILFDANGNSSAYVGGGWVAPEARYRWAQGAESELFLPLDTLSFAGAVEYGLQLDIEPFTVPDALPTQRLTIVANAQEIHRVEVSPGRSIVDCRLPFDLANTSDVLHIRFLHPDARPPADLLSESNDRKALSFRFFRIVINGISRDSARRGRKQIGSAQP